MDTNENIPYDVVLLPTQAETVAFRKKAAADAGPRALFGVVVTTFPSWIADLWELHGDGRRIASAIERDMVSRSVCEQAKCALGVDGVVSECLSRACGLAEFDKAVKEASRGAAPEGFSSGEVEALRLCGEVFGVYGELALVEFGEAARIVCESLADRALRIHVSLGRPLDAIEERFFEGLPLVSVSFEGDGRCEVSKVPASVSVRFGFPSGRYAEPALVNRSIVPFLAKGNVLVASRDPLELFSLCCEGLAKAGTVCTLATRVPFSQTDFGRAFFAVRAFLSSDEWAASDLADFLLSPLSGVASSTAYAIDARVRGDRLVTRESIVSELREESRTFELLEEIVSDPEADILLGAFEDIIASLLDRCEAWRREQLRAVSVLREVTTAARLIGADMGACAALLNQASVPVARVLNPQVEGDSSSPEEDTRSGFPVVSFVDYSGVGAVGGSTYALVVAADLTSAAYPAADADSAADSLLQKRGIVRADSALSRMRRAFCALEQMAEEELLVVRCLNDSDAEPTYPAAALEEFIDCYRSDPSATDDIDNPYALPPCLMEGISECGEEALVENALAGRLAAPESTSMERPIAGEVSPDARPYVVLPRIVGSQVVEDPCLSPSQIESYLECPYKWFAQRRLRLETIDEGFGALQMGDFAHAAFKSFYTHFQEEVATKVTEQTLPEARRIMSDVVDRHLTYQAGMKPTDNRLLPKTELEQREVAELKRKLVGFLPFEAKLLPSFRPAYLEYDVAQGSVAEYAGHTIVGTADRIDVDESGHAVVLDYKASISPAYDYAERAETGAGKVQALIYAQVVRRSLGLEVAGALYVRYGKTCKASGTYDGTYLEAPHLPNMRHARCEVSPASGLTFDDVLDQTEEAVARGIDRMLAGDVRPNPQGAYACKYCPVLSCPERIR